MGILVCVCVCVCGVCLGAQVQEAAAAAGMEPGDFCDAISQRFRDAFEAFAIEPTDFVRTTEPRHHKVHERQQSCVAAPPFGSHIVTALQTTDRHSIVGTSP